MWISFPIFPGVRVGGRVGGRRSNKPNGCAMCFFGLLLLSAAVHYWHVTLFIIGAFVVCCCLAALAKPQAKQPSKQSKHRA